nr:hypothetical protein pPsy0462a_00048 [Pseudomonas syringae]
MKVQRLKTAKEGWLVVFKGLYLIAFPFFAHICNFVSDRGCKLNWRRCFWIFCVCRTVCGPCLGLFDPFHSWDFKSPPLIEANHDGYQGQPVL